MTFEGYHARAIDFHRADKLDLAIEDYLRALALAPEQMETRYNLGIAYLDRADFESAAECFRKVAEGCPGFQQAYHNFCICLQECGRFEEAEHHLRRLLSNFPGSGEAWFNLGCLTLLRGDFGVGLQLYEWRFLRKEPVPERRCVGPRWDGAASSGETLLLHAEQGFGDTIQAVRFASLAARRGWRVILEVPQVLKRLLQGIPGVSSVVARGESLPEYDSHLPLMSLPLIFIRAEADIPCEVPYIRPEPQLADYWRRRLSVDGGVKVGVIWSGRMDHPINRKRSCPLEVLLPLGSLPGVSLYALQGSSGENRDADLSTAGIKDLSGELSDFADTAACMASLDLVISIDTAGAHLSGALGVPTWLLLPHVPDWRWMLDREDSPWYPTMRLFRQRSRGAWAEVVERIAGELLRLANRQARATGGSPKSMVTDGQDNITLPHQDSLSPEECLRRGAELHSLERCPEAVAMYDRAIAAAPGFGPAYHNRGNALLEMGRFPEAIASYRQAISLMPGFAEGYVTIATALQAMGRPYEAMASCYRALALDPECAEAHWNLALALLQIGEFGQGWREFEWRWKKRGYTSPRRSYPEPEWDGSPLAGRTIFLHAEQGFGDSFQFARFIPLVAERGGRVVLECPAPLADLMSGVEGVGRIVAAGEEIPSFQVHLPLMSLPGVLGVAIEGLPGKVPYLFPGESALAAWVGRLPADGSFRVGIVWAGRKRPDPNRTCPLRFLEGLSGVEGVTLFSLQVGELTAEDRTVASAMGMVDMTEHLKNFSDTAAFIAQMHLVISIDTGVAHLAGGMGKQTWVILPHAADWRWMLEREDSPWYPTARLFRQERPGDWPGVASRLVSALRNTMADRSQEAQRALSALESAYNQGMISLASGDTKAAWRAACRALAIDPAVAEVYNLMGIICRENGMGSQATGFFQRAVEIDPGFADGHINLGNVFHDRDLHEDAVGAYLQAIAADPSSAKAYQNLGVTWQAMGRLDAAESAFARALAVEPGFATAGWNLAVLKLLRGDLAEGFAGFNARFCKSAPVPLLHGERPQWDGTPLPGLTLLIHAEQGFGDTLQFVRYLELCREKGGRVIFECQDKSLLGVLESSCPGVEIFVRGATLPPFDLQAPLMSLPAILGTTAGTIPARIPYLTIAPDRVRSWQGLLAPDQGLKVGLVWSGRPKPDPRRSASLAAMEPLGSVPGVRFYSLQVGDGAEQLRCPPPGLEITDLGGRLTDFTETGALIANLDLVITIDSAVAHLAGGLGRNVWVLLPFAPDWRWQLERPDCPWYPTMRLFRQQSPGDWQGVVQRVREDLVRLVSS